MSDALKAINRRKMIMFAVVALAGVAAVISAYASFRLGQAWGMPAFVVALVTGFGAQLWFILSLRKGGSQ